MKLQGIKQNCHFSGGSEDKPVCRALRDFYNIEDKCNVCGKCPFYKTDEEFLKGWERRFGDDQGRLKRIV